MHLGRPHVIGCWEVDGALVDPGPESSLRDRARRRSARTSSRGRCSSPTSTSTTPPRPGALVGAGPSCEVYVHERGAPHLIDPSKLLASAGRLYGDQMEHLWGEIVPVPEANVHVLAGGETVLGMGVAYTPGHASHHVCYLHEESGTAFVGDVAACGSPAPTWSSPPTPPPDIDIEAWERLDRDRRGLGAGAAGAHPLRPDRGRRPRTWRALRETPARGGRAGPADERRGVRGRPRSAGSSERASERRGRRAR